MTRALSLVSGKHERSLVSASELHVDGPALMKALLSIHLEHKESL